MRTCCGRMLKFIRCDAVLWSAELMPCSFPYCDRTMLSVGKSILIVMFRCLICSLLFRVNDTMAMTIHIWWAVRQWEENEMYSDDIHYSGELTRTSFVGLRDSCAPHMDQIIVAGAIWRPCHLTSSQIDACAMHYSRRCARRRSSSDKNPTKCFGHSLGALPLTAVACLNRYTQEGVLS